VNKRTIANILLLLTLFSSMAWRSSLAQSAGEQYFKETGHWVKGEFLTKYNSVPDPLARYGYPITEAFLDQTRNLLVQYFQKARFEMHPEAPPGQLVHLTPLGDLLYEPGAPVPSGVRSSTCRTFENGYKVCYSLLKFFDQNGGLAQFGLPISNLEYRNGLMVQYFQYARFEFNYRSPLGEMVGLAHLGREYFTMIGENPRRLLPAPGNFTFQTILSLRVRAYPLRAVTSLKGEQTIYVVVQDQTLLRVPGAQVTIAVQMPSGEQNLYIVQNPTNENGITKITFHFDSKEVGIVQITVKATRDTLEAKTTTSFRVWW
jgi:hypothetical protein